MSSSICANICVWVYVLCSFCLCLRIKVDKNIKWPLPWRPFGKVNWSWSHSSSLLLHNLMSTLPLHCFCHCIALIFLFELSPRIDFSIWTFHPFLSLSFVLLPFFLLVVELESIDTASIFSSSRCYSSSTDLSISKRVLVCCLVCRIVVVIITRTAASCSGFVNLYILLCVFVYLFIYSAHDEWKGSHHRIHI